MLRPSTMPVTSSIRSASVDLPWSMWAMMQKFRMRAGSVRGGCQSQCRHRPTPRPAGAERRAVGTPTRVAAARRDAPACGRAPATLVSWQAGPLARPRALRARTHCQKYSLLRDTRGSRVANIKSQIKRIKTNEKARQRNVAVKSALKTSVRRFRTAADVRGRRRRRPPPCATASKALDKAASKGVIHKNQAANRKSGLAKQVAGL